MKTILILGAGKSSSYLIKHLVEQRNNLNISLAILDLNIAHLEGYSSMDRVSLVRLSSGTLAEYEPHIENSFLTISMLPAFMHIEVAKLCLTYGSHLVTPSYISDEMQSLSKEAESKDLIFLNELGFDPGIDHLTTMKIYEEIVQQGGKLISYRSYAGGLVAPKCDDNPWHYKFSWNPRNVILAGQGGDIKYKKKGREEILTYSNLFKQSELLKLSNGQIFDAYANRDSLKYEKLYGWSSIDTLIRGTLRIHGFCEAWALLVDLGITDDTVKNRLFKGKSFSEFYTSFLHIPLNEFLNKQNNSIKEKLESIGFSDTKSQIQMDGSAAEILQSILVDKWKLNPEDTDWVVMVHFFTYEIGEKKFEIESCFSLDGESSTFTAMSKTVGMPIAFAAELIIQNEIKAKGVLMPTSSEIYLPILKKLEEIGITFKEIIREI
jgi:saccharopine dehydrogenase-like NADP-dependent oxidoreductase